MFTLCHAAVTTETLSPKTTNRCLSLATLAQTQQTWRWRGHHIQYVDVGSGPVLILVHGFGAAIGHWRKNIPVLAAAGYRVLALDLLGFGHSEKPPLDYSLDLWQALLADFWAEKVQQPAVFIGNSIGALLSLMMAADYPHMTQAAVLLNCAGGLNHRPEELPLPLRLIMGTFTRVVSSPWLGQFMFDRIRQKHRIRATLKQVYGNPEAVTDELVEMLYAPACDPGAQQVFASILTAPAGPHPRDLLPRVSCPLLVLWGDADPWTPVTGGQIFQQPHWPAAIEFMAIPQTGHCPHDERPEIVNDRILTWLANFKTVL